MKGKNVVVTGGAGFIGSNLVLELERQNYKVTVLDNLFTGTENNLNGFKGKFINVDISQPFDIKERFDVIFHQAAITDPRFDNDDVTTKVNIDGFKNIIELAKKNNSKLVYASSASMYGNGPVPMKEDQEKDLLSTYAKSKLMMDDIAKELFDEMHIVGLRYFNVFGPREAHKGRPASMIYHLSKQILSGKKPRLFRMGEQKRDHIYVKDCVTATLKALEAPSGVYNVGTGVGTSFNDLIKILNEVWSTDYYPEYFDNPYEGTYQNNTQADTYMAEKHLKFKAKWSLKKGIEDYKNGLE